MPRLSQQNLSKIQEDIDYCLTSTNKEKQRQHLNNALEMLNSVGKLNSQQTKLLLQRIKKIKLHPGNSSHAAVLVKALNTKSEVTESSRLVSSWSSINSPIFSTSKNDTKQRLLSDEPSDISSELELFTPYQIQHILIKMPESKPSQKKKDVEDLKRVLGKLSDFNAYRNPKVKESCGINLGVICSILGFLGALYLIRYIPDPLDTDYYNEDIGNTTQTCSELVNITAWELCKMDLRLLNDSSIEQLCQDMAASDWLCSIPNPIGVMIFIALIIFGSAAVITLSYKGMECVTLCCRNDFQEAGHLLNNKDKSILKDFYMDYDLQHVSRDQLVKHIKDCIAIYSSLSKLDDKITDLIVEKYFYPDAIENLILERASIPSTSSLELTPRTAFY